MTLTEIDSNLIQSDSGTLPSNLVAIAVMINEDGIGQHSAIIIGVNRTYYLFHYTSEFILLENNIPQGRWYYHKVLEAIPQDESEAFLSHCESISRDNRDIKYGFIFDGSYYRDGVYFSNSGLPEFSTCVGFCINVITGYLWDSDFLKVDDWHTQPIRNGFIEFYERAKLAVPDLDEELYKIHHKRIQPDECTASAYITELPVTKKAVDEIIADVRLAISQKRTI